MTPRLPSICLLVLATQGVGVAGAQDDSRFREVEPGIEDVGSGAVSTLLRPVDLRAPTNFERVYEVLGTGMFARRAGAVTAVFDRSLYVGGGTPVIPPGTVFYLGSLPVNLESPGLFAPTLPANTGAAPARMDTLVATSQSGDGGPPLRVAQRVDLRIDASEPQLGPPRVEQDLNIWTSEPYRQRRIGELIRAAAWRARQLEAARATEQGES